MPGTVYDAKGLLKSAIRDNSPVIVIENRVLFYEEEKSGGRMDRAAGSGGP